MKKNAGNIDVIKKLNKLPKLRASENFLAKLHNKLYSYDSSVSSEEKTLMHLSPESRNKIHLLNKFVPDYNRGFFQRQKYYRTKRFTAFTGAFGFAVVFIVIVIVIYYNTNLDRQLRTVKDEKEILSEQNSKVQEKLYISPESIKSKLGEDISDKNISEDISSQTTPEEKSSLSATDNRYTDQKTGESYRKMKKSGNIEEKEYTGQYGIKNNGTDKLEIKTENIPEKTKEEKISVESKKPAEEKTKIDNQKTPKIPKATIKIDSTLDRKTDFARNNNKGKPNIKVIEINRETLEKLRNEIIEK